MALMRWTTVYRLHTEQHTSSIAWERSGSKIWLFDFNSKLWAVGFTSCYRHHFCRYAVTIWYLDKTERHQAKTAQTKQGKNCRDHLVMNHSLVGSYFLVYISGSGSYFMVFEFWKTGGASVLLFEFEVSWFSESKAEVMASRRCDHFAQYQIWESDQVFGCNLLTWKGM